MVWTDYKTGKPISEARRPETRRSHFLDRVRRGTHLQAVAYLLGSEGESMGRYLFLRPGLDDGQRELAVTTADQDFVEAFAAASEAVLAAWEAGSFFPRLVELDGRKEPGRCGFCSVAEACLRHDSGARQRLYEWTVEAGLDVARRPSRRRCCGSGGWGRTRWAPAGIPEVTVLRSAIPSRTAEPDPRAADLAARRAAQTRFDVPLVLQAGAGTGKTTTLIGRLLAWTLGEGWERAARRLAERAERKTGRRADEGPDRVAAEVLGRVVAITFTEAAAAEMAGRAARELAVARRRRTRRRAGSKPRVLPPAPERARRARALLGTLDHLAVRTIHAFCRGLLADHPLEAGVHPDLTIDADGRLVEEVVRETVEDALRDGYGDPGDPHLLALAVARLRPAGDRRGAGRPAPGRAAGRRPGRGPVRPEALRDFRRRARRGRARRSTA